MTTSMQCLDTLWGDEIGNALVTTAQHVLEGLRTRGLTITTLTIKRLLLSRKTIVLLLLCAIPIFMALYWLTTDAENGYSFFSTLVYLSFLFFIVLIISLLYGVSTFNDDITDKTITYLISRPVDRTELAIYKYIGYIISAIVVVLPPLVLTFFIIAIKAGGVGDNIGLLGTYIGVLILAILGYGPIFMFFGLLFKRPLLISFVFMFGWEVFVAHLPLIINRITLRHYLESICYHTINIGETKNVFSPADSIPSVGVLLVTALIFLIFSCIIARYKDFV